MLGEQPRRWCLFTSAGDKNVIDGWLKRSSGRRWDLVVAYYGDDDQKYLRLSKESFYAFRTKGGKFQNLKKLVVQNPKFFDQYSYVWVCDDDILMSAEQIDEVFAITQTFAFWVAQPALSLQGSNSHEINCYVSTQVDYRIVNFVEVGVPIFRRDKLLEFLRVYDGSLTGWGIDYWYMNVFGANECGRFAVIDKVQVTNPSDEEKGGREIDRLQPAEAREAAWNDVRKKLGLIEFPHKVFAYCKIAAQENFGVAHKARESPSILAMAWRDWKSRLRQLSKKVDARIVGSAKRETNDLGDRDFDSIHQSAPRQTLAERLGYGPAARLLIVHADDIAVTHSVNVAFIRGLESGLINSGSVMVGCPWVPEIAAYARAHPEADLGVHLTLTSERTHYRWGPTAPRMDVPSLVDRLGYLHQTWLPETQVNLHEVEIELRAQIEKAYAAGLRPTHLDSHQYRLQMGGRDLFSVFLRLGREYRLPVFVARNWFGQCQYLNTALTRDDIVIDHTVTIDPAVAPEEWSDFYRRAIESLPSGVTEMVIHPGLNDAELQAYSADRPTWGAAWRQRDFDFFTSREFRALLAKHDVRLINWREIATRLRQGDTRIANPD